MSADRYDDLAHRVLDGESVPVREKNLRKLTVKLDPGTYKASRRPFIGGWLYVELRDEPVEVDRAVSTTAGFWKKCTG